MPQLTSRSPRNLTMPGLLVALVCIVALILFSLLIALGYAEFRCEYYPFLILATAFGFGIASSLFTGSISLRTGSHLQEHEIGSARGLIYSTLQSAIGHPVVVSASGGAAVFLLTLLVGHLIEPERCAFDQESTIRFENVPSHAQVSIKGGKFWIKQHGHDRQALLQSFSILAEQDHTEGILHLHFEEQGTRCELVIATADDYDSAGDDTLSVVESNTNAETLLILYDVPLSTVNKNTAISCFKRNNNPLRNRILWNIGDRQLLTQKSDPGKPNIVFLHNPWFIHPRLEGSHLKRKRDDNRRQIQFWNVAFAEDDPRSYTELATELAHSNVEIRDSAIQYLGKHFDAYADNAVDAIFDLDTDRRIVAGILSALTIGIEDYQPELVPQGNRKLNTEIEFLSGKEEALIELTAHENLVIQKSALEIIRRFPVDAFLKKYNDIIRNATSGGCNKEDVDQRVYGAVFYFANRELQPILDQKIDGIVRDRSKSTKIIDDVRTAANTCLKDEYSVDSAVFAFVPVVEILNLRPNAKDELAEAARNFLDEIGSRERDYYDQTHIFYAAMMSGDI